MAVTEEVAETPAEREERERLDCCMRRMLIRLEVEISYGATANYNAGSHSHPDSKPPTGDNRPAHDAFRERYNGQPDNVGRARVIEAAEVELASWRRHTSTVEVEISVDQLVVQDGIGHDAEMVGQRYGLSASHVRRIRKRAGVRADDGTSADEDKLPTAERRREVLRLREEKKLSVRQIAAILKVSTTLIDKDLRLLRQGA